MEIQNTTETNLTLFKDKIIKKICKDDIVIKLLNPVGHEELDIEDILRGGKWQVDGELIEEQGYIFDFNYVNQTTTEEKAFICVEALPSYYQYPLIDVSLYIHIYVHRGIMQLTSNKSVNPSSPTKNEMSELGYIGNRCDQLIQAVGRLINGATDIGGISEIKPHNRGFIVLETINNNFYGKCLIYNVKMENVEADGCEN